MNWNCCNLAIFRDRNRIRLGVLYTNGGHNQISQSRLAHAAEAVRLTCQIPKKFSGNFGIIPLLLQLKSENGSGLHFIRLELRINLISMISNKTMK